MNPTIQEIVRQRTSVRGYKAEPIAQVKQEAVGRFIDGLGPAPQAIIRC